MRKIGRKKNRVEQADNEQRCCKNVTVWKICVALMHHALDLRGAEGAVCTYPNDLGLNRLPFKREPDQSVE
jgi:hypothetical protein